MGATAKKFPGGELPDDRELRRSLEIVARAAGGWLKEAHFEVCAQCRTQDDNVELCPTGQMLFDAWDSATTLAASMRLPARRAGR
jgi:hypothetical protein